MSSPTLYEAIGVTPDASEERIRKATRRMARKVKKSDTSNSEKNKVLRFIKETRETLFDEDSRAEYDSTIGIETVRRSRNNISTNMHQMVPHGSSSINPISSMMGSGGLFSMINDMSSIIPEEMMSSGNVSSGSFRVMEYTRIRNNNGYEEFGMTREGDSNNDRVTEKHFQRRT